MSTAHAVRQLELRTVCSKCLDEIPSEHFVRHRSAGCKSFDQVLEEEMNRELVRCVFGCEEIIREVDHSWHKDFGCSTATFLGH